ncbi:MAG: LPP20 family lipoprotein [Bacteroidetes bacterium]|nr:LPP20 family lipoprotein [Bacteroidota bacterium]
MRKNIYFLLFTILVLFQACKSSQPVVQQSESTIPQWVSSRPVMNDYYIGIGMAKKSGLSDNYIAVARNNALNDLVSEISIKISGNSMFYQFENRTELKEEFKTYTNTSIKENLEGYELSASWGNDNEYWVFYKLSKKLYADIKAKKLEDIKKRSLSFFEKGNEYEENADYNNAIISYLKAFDVIKKHLSDELTIFSPTKGNINLGTEIYNSVQDILHNIHLKPNIDKLFVSLSTPITKDIVVTAMYQDVKSGKTATPVSSLPIYFIFEKGKSVLNEKINTNTLGEAILSTAKVTNKGKVQQIKASLDIDAMMGDIAKDKLSSQLFAFESNIPVCKITVDVEGKKAFMEIEENDFGLASQRKTIGNGFKKELSEKLFSFTESKEKADVTVKISSKTTKGTYLEKNDLYVVFVDCEISIIDNKTNTEIFSNGFTNFKGMQIRDYENALKDAQQKALQKISNEIIPELNNLDL